jgi:glycosyltransferase involved in cell wall biosynthesis
VNRFLPVTRSLKERVYALVQPVPSTVIPNVADTSVFYLKENIAKDNTFQFVHVSGMSYQKNPQALLRAFKEFNADNPDTCLWMVGPHVQDVLNYAQKIGLNENVVHFTGAVTYFEVAEILALSKALVLFSRFENLPCVILEALCCGLPVISSNVGGIPEVIDASNGILVNYEDEQALTNAFARMYVTYNSYDRKNIALSASKLFSYRAVGRLINQVYNEAKHGR